MDAGSPGGETEAAGPRARRAAPSVWLVRGVTGAMLLVSLVVAARKFRTTPEQEELSRYAELTVPVYLHEVAEVEERLDRLAATTSADDARRLLVDETMPLIVKARRHATQVSAQAESVRAANAEYVAAIEKLLEVARTGVRAIDDPDLAAEAGHRQLRDRRREADDAIRAWMANLRRRCESAGLKLRAAGDEAGAR